MKKRKSSKLYLTSTLFGIVATSLVAIPFAGVIQNEESKTEFEMDGFSLVTPQYPGDQTINPPITDASLFSFEFTQSTEKHYNGIIEGLDYQRENQDSKSFIGSLNQFTIKFGLPVSLNPNEQVRLMTAGMYDGNNTIKDFVDIDLALGTGFNQPPIEDGESGTRTRVNPILSAHMSVANRRIWLVTQGWFDNAFGLMLQTFSFAFDTTNRQITSFTREATTKNLPIAEGSNFDNNPIVISPIYELDNQGNVTQLGNEVLIWQQNNNYNNLNVQKFTWGALNNPVQVNMGQVIGDQVTAAITPIKKGSDMQYFVHHTSQASLGLSLSRFENPTSTSVANETLELNSEINFNGMDVANEMPYAKIVKTPSGNEMIWAFAKNGDGKIFSTSINANLNDIDNNGNTTVDLAPIARNIKKIEYTNLGTYENETAFLSIKLDNSPIADLPTRHVPTLLNISQMKKDPSDPASFINDIIPYVYYGQLTNVFRIMKFDEANNSVTYGAYFNSRSIKQERKISDLQKTFYQTIVPTQIMQPIDVNNPAFSPTTPEEQLSNLIIKGTRNDTAGANIIDKVYNEQDKYWDVIYYPSLGEFSRNTVENPNAGGAYLKAVPNYQDFYVNPGEGKLGPLPEVPSTNAQFRRVKIFQQTAPTTVYPIKASLNKDYFSAENEKLLPSQFMTKIAEEMELVDGIPANFNYNEAIYGKFVGKENDSVIQIDPWYINSLTSIIVNADDSNGSLEIDLVFYNPNSTETPTLRITYNDFVSVFTIDPVIVAIGAGVSITLLVIILTVIFLLLKKRKKQDMTKALNAGFSLHSKLGDKGDVNILNDGKVQKPATKSGNSQATNNTQKIASNNQQNNTQKMNGSNQGAYVQPPVDPNQPMNNLRRPMNHQRRQMTQNPNQVNNQGKSGQPTKTINNPGNPENRSN